MRKLHIVMIGPSLESLGGISSVVNVYRRAGLFERWPVAYIATYKDGSFFEKARTALSGFFRYMALLLAGSVAALHVHSASRRSFVRKSLFILITWMFGKPIILHVHGGEFINVYRGELGPAGRAYVRFILRRCKDIIVLSKRWKVMLYELGLDTPVRVVMNPVDGPATIRSRQVRQAGALLFLGNLSESKGIYVLVESLSRLAGDLEWSLTISGTGDTQAVKARIQRHGVGDRIRLLGWVDDVRKVRLLERATALVLPSYAEGLPMSVLEAMAHGTAVITTPVGGIPDVIEHGVEGLLVPPGDTEKLANAIRYVLSNPTEAALMGEAGRRKFEVQFSANVVVPKVEATYAELGIRGAEETKRNP